METKTRAKTAFSFTFPERLNTFMSLLYTETYKVIVMVTIMVLILILGLQ